MCTEHSGIYAKEPVKNIPRFMKDNDGFLLVDTSVVLGNEPYRT